MPWIFTSQEIDKRGQKFWVHKDDKKKTMNKDGALWDNHSGGFVKHKSLRTN